LELRRGEPIVPLEPDIADFPSSFLLKPLILENHPNVIYAPGGSGKSYLALFAAFLLACGASSNNLTCDPEPRRVWYLDWELSEGDMKARAKMLMAGHPESYAAVFRTTEGVFAPSQTISVNCEGCPRGRL